MPSLSFALLGTPDIRVDGQPIAFATRKATAVLIYLAIEGQPVARDTLLALLWPEGDSARNRGALRTALAYVRRGLGACAGRLQPEGDNLAFVPAAGDVVDVGELAAAAGRDDAAPLQAAIERYRGDFLAGFSPAGAPEFDSWASAQRERCHRLLSDALQRLSYRQLDERAYAAGLATARRWTEHDPLDEGAWRRLMQLHLAAGDRAGVVTTFERLRQRLAQDLGLAPGRATLQLLELARRGQGASDRVRPVPQPAPAAPTGPLPNQLPFVGRLEEQHQFVAAFREPTPQVIVIGGEAGIGKTRLAEEFIAWAEAQGAEVLRGRAFEAGGRLPYQPLVDALRRRVASVNAPEDLLPDAWLAELSRLLPEMRERYPDLPAPSDDEDLARTQLPEAVARLLSALGARAGAPVVLFVDDLQWADAASLDVLAYLARRLAAESHPLLLLLAARAEALVGAQPLAAWLAGLARDAPVTRLAPGPMGPDDVAQLLRDLKLEAGLAAEMGAWLIAETKGQPFFVAETLKALAASSWPPKTMPRGFMPSSVRAMILARLTGLMPAGRELLLAAAVLGRPASFEELSAVAGLDEPAALPALDADLAARLLIEAGDPRPYLLAHDQIREVLLLEAGEARRRIFHRRALLGLAGQAQPAELAHHALAAGLPGPALGHSLAAAEAALRLFAVRDALHHFDQAQALLLSGQLKLSPDEARRLYLGLARAHELLAQPAGAWAAYDSLLAYARAGNDLTLAGIALSHLATLAVHGYAFAEAAAYLREAAQLAEQAGDEASLADREWRLAQLAHHQLDFRTSLVHGQRALALARSLRNGGDDAPLIAGCLNTVGYARILLGDLDGGAAAMGEARARYAALGDRAMEVDCLTALASVNVWRGQAAAAAALAERAQAMAREIENPWGQVYSSNWLAIARLDLGDLDAALAAAQAGRLVVESHSFMPVAIPNLLVLGIAWRAMGQTQQARDLHQAAQALSTTGDAQAFAEQVAGELCSDSVLLGDWTAAAEYARAAVAARRYESLPLIIPLRWTETEAMLRAGWEDLAREDAEKWGTLVAGVPRLRLANLRSLAALARHSGDEDRARALLDEARSLGEALAVMQTH